MKKESQKLQASTQTTHQSLNLLLDCPACSSFIPAQNVNAEKNIAKCDHCNHTFSMENEIFNDPIGKFVASPPGMDVLKLSAGLDVIMSRRQQTDKSRILPIVFFAGIWNLMLIPFVVNFVTSGLYFGLLLLGAHLYVGLGMLVSIFRSLLNEVHIDYNETTLTVKEGPIKWFGLGKVSIDSRKISNFFIKKGNSKNIAEQNVGRNMSVYAKLKNGRTAAIIRQVGIDNAEYLVETLNETRQRLE